jgi:hypothetical protein
MLIEAIHPKVVETIKTTIMTMLSDYDITRIDVEAREDSTGDDAIFVDVYRRPSDKPFDAQRSLELRTEVWDRVYRLGDKRFPYIFYHHVRGQDAKA